MKKIFTTILAFVLMAAMFSVAALALSIDYCNLSFKDSVYIKYAVDSDNSDVKLLVWTTPQANYAFGTQDHVLEAKGTENINGTDYYIFDYTKLAARHMTDYVYARAYNQSTDSYSEAVKYSILKYAYNMLGKTSDKVEADMKPLLENMLSYGASAQTYFNYKADRLANADFYEVRLTNGTLAQDGFVSGLYLAGEQAAIKAEATDANGVPFAAWKDSTGAVVATTAEYTVTVGTKNEVYTAVYSDKPVVNYSEGLEYATNDDGTCYVASMDKCTDKEVIIPEKDPKTGDTIIGIDRNAFSGKEITSITIPATVEEIARNAFYNCNALTDVYYHGTQSDWADISIAAGNEVIKSATIHYLVTIEYTVTFVDYDGTVLKTEKVASGKSATAPQEPTRDGFTFAGWDKAFANVSADLTVKATYTFYSTEPTIVVNSVNAVAGQENVEVVVELFNNPGLGVMGLTLEYDENAMTLTKATNGTALPTTEDRFFFQRPANTNSGMLYSWLYIGDKSNFPQAVFDGTILTLKFDIKDTTKQGDYKISFSYLNDEVKDFENGLPVELDILSGKINVL